jgi:Rhodopirellula transposase DDE domain
MEIAKTRAQVKLWKRDLPRFANETGLKITVNHLPPGTSSRVDGWRGGIKPSHSAGQCADSARRRGRASHRDARPDTGDIRCPLVRCVAPTSVADVIEHTSAPTCRSEERALG